jgi:hypothetical protein
MGMVNRFAWGISTATKLCGGGIAQERKEPLFRTSRGRSGELTGNSG